MASDPVHTLVLLRHGQSEWNLENRFTGWWDVGLSEQGRREAHEAGLAMMAAGIAPDVVHTSLLRRSIQTASIALAAMAREWLPVRRDWRLNERHYGALTGLDKAETAATYGAEQVHLWRRSYRVVPPLMDDGHRFDVSVDDRYRSLGPDGVPRGESLADVVERLVPYWHEAIAADLTGPAQSGSRTVLVSAHGNSLRALVKHLEGIGDDEIAELNIPTGVPLTYGLDRDLAVADGLAVAARYLT